MAPSNVLGSSEPRPIFPLSEHNYEQTLLLGDTQLTVKESSHPVVGGGGSSYNPPNCLFKDDHNSWCFSTTNPVMKVGWAFDQTVNSNGDSVNWMIQWLPYIQAKIDFTSSFILQRLVTADLKFVFDEFKQKLVFSFLFQTDGQVCGGLGWKTDSVNFDILLNFFFQDCYKRLVADVCKLAIDDTTKYVDECTNSSSPGDVKIEEWALAREDKQFMLGGYNQGGPGCFKFAKWTKWAPFYAQYAQTTLQSLFDNA